MKIKLYQTQVGAGWLAALLLAALRVPNTTDKSVLAALEALSFLLCCAGIITGGRAIRAKFVAFNSDKSIARGDPTYMRDRRDLQITAAVACSGVASLLASRNGFNPFYTGLIVLVVAGIALPITNRLRGWTH